MFGNFRTHPYFGQFLDRDLPTFSGIGRNRTDIFMKLAPLIFIDHLTHHITYLWNMLKIFWTYYKEKKAVILSGDFNYNLIDVKQDEHTLIFNN